MALFGRRKRNMEQQYAGTNTSVMIPALYDAAGNAIPESGLTLSAKTPRLAVVDRIASDLFYLQR